MPFLLLDGHTAHPHFTRLKMDAQEIYSHRELMRFNRRRISTIHQMTDGMVDSILILMK